MAAKGKSDYPKTISFGSGKVRIVKRSNGFFALRWREMGAERTTTKATEAKALAWARDKALELDSGSGRQWVHQGEAEAVTAILELAGESPGALRRLVDDLRGALRWLAGGTADLTTAARWFAENGPMKVERSTAAAAIGRFLLEYQKAPKATLDTFTTELDAFAQKFPELLLLDVTHEILERWCRRPLLKKGVVTKEAPAARTHVNRITTWVTFLNRARDWNLLGPGKHAADLLRKPVLPDEGKQVFTIDQGRRLLAAAAAEDERLLVYALIAGWIGLRPSEVQRLRWVEPGGIERGGFDWNGYLHVSARVAGKNSSERFIPLDARLEAILKGVFTRRGAKGGLVCIFRSREFLSVLARRMGVCEKWPADVLRHSFCSYRIAVVKSLEQVATEADNSPAILKSNYRRPLREEDGLAWWDLLDGLGQSLKSAGGA